MISVVSALAEFAEAASLPGRLSQGASSMRIK